MTQIYENTWCILSGITYAIMVFKNSQIFQDISSQILEVYCINLYMSNEEEIQKCNYHSSYNLIHVYYYLSKNNLPLQLHDAIYVHME